ncbi:MAG: hypothetical protein KAU90_01675, partial [Sulfurovaceae bacterium]|nr:hypothetical protein [Sulfurovaceae bacterium]
SYNKSKQKKKTLLFKISKEQKKEWFQGIVMVGETIFVLSGKNKVTDKKILSLYTKGGKFLKTFNIIAPKTHHKKDKWELEGLSFENGVLYTTINTNISNKKRKYLLQLMKVSK